MEHAAEADLLRSARDRVVNFPHSHELEHLHPVPQIVEHEDKVVVVLERLAFHPRDRLQFLLGVLLVVHQLADLVLHEAGQLDVEGRVGVSDGAQDPPQSVLVEFGQFREAVVGQQVGEFLRFAGIVLLVNVEQIVQPTLSAMSQQ